MNEIELTRLVKPLDIGFTSGHNNPWTVANRASGCGLKHAFDRKYTTHTLLFRKDAGVVLVDEVNQQGADSDSAAKYLNDGKEGKLIAIYRYKHWTEYSILRAQEYIASLAQKDEPYSIREAIGKNRVMRMLFPKWTAKYNTRPTCDELPFIVTSRFGGWGDYPNIWETDRRYLHPHKLRTLFVLQPNNFDLIWRE